MYASYPTATLDKNDRLSLSATIEQIKILWGHTLNTYANDILLPPQDISTLLGWLGEEGGATIVSVFFHFPALDQPRLWRTLAWLQKLGIVKNSACQR